MTETNIGHAVLQLRGPIGGLLFIAAAVRAVVIGDFTGPKGIKYGVIYGVAHIDREERPLAIWACVTSYVGFGAAILGCVWFVTRVGIR